MTRNAIIFCIATLLALVACAYAPVTFQPAGFIWDDDVHVTNLQALRSADGLARIWLWPVQKLQVGETRQIIPATPQYYPLTFTSFWLEYQIAGDNPRLYHINNVLLHLASALILWRILTLIGLRPLVAFAAAAIFAVHPVHVESVAWISERKNTLSLFLFLLAAWAFIHWTLAEHKRALPYILALLLFVLAVAAKTVTIVLPAILLIWLWASGKLTKKHTLALFPMFALAALAGWWTSHVEHNYIITPAVLATPDFDLSFTQRLFIAGRAVTFYITKLLLPFNLTFMYPRWSVDPALYTWWLYPIGVALVTLALTITAFFKKSLRPAAFAILFFLVAIGPALGFINYYPMIYSFVADHFQYIASIGIITLIVAAVAALLTKLEDAPRRILGGTLTALILIPLAYLSYSQSTHYQDVRNLWFTTIKRNPTAWAAYQNLGDLLVNDKPADALRLYEKARELRPDHVPIYNALGIAHMKLGNMQDAEMILNEGIDRDPGNYLINLSMGSALMAQGKHRQAEIVFKRALSARPDSSETWDNLGNALRNQAIAGNDKKYDEAVEAFKKALDANGRNPSAYNNLGLTHMAKATYLEALAAATKAAISARKDAVTAQSQELAQLEADAARYVAQSQREFALAEQSFKQALLIAPKMAQVHNNLGQLYRRLNKNEEALQSFINATQCDDKLAIAYYGAGEVLGAMGKQRDAVSYLRAALHLNRNLAAANGALAEILATTDKPDIRSMGEALELAERAVQSTNGQEIIYLELLAQLRSTNTQHRSAVRIQERALQLATERNLSEDQLEPIRQRLDLYKKLAAASPDF